MESDLKRVPHRKTYPVVGDEQSNTKGNANEGHNAQNQAEYPSGQDKVPCLHVVLLERRILALGFGLGRDMATCTDLVHLDCVAPKLRKCGARALKPVRLLGGRVPEF